MTNEAMVVRNSHNENKPAKKRKPMGLRFLAGLFSNKSVFYTKSQPLLETAALAASCSASCLERPLPSATFS